MGYEPIQLIDKNAKTDEFFDFLHQKIKAAGTQTAFARQVGISKQYLSDILSRRRKPGKKLLKRLGFQCVVSYIPLNNASTPTSRPKKLQAKIRR